MVAADDHEELIGRGDSRHPGVKMKSVSYILQPPRSVGDLMDDAEPIISGSHDSWYWDQRTFRTVDTSHIEIAGERFLFGKELDSTDPRKHRFTFKYSTSHSTEAPLPVQVKLRIGDDAMFERLKDQHRHFVITVQADKLIDEAVGAIAKLLRQKPPSLALSSLVAMDEMALGVIDARKSDGKKHPSDNADIDGSGEYDEDDEEGGGGSGRRDGRAAAKRRLAMDSRSTSGGSAGAARRRAPPKSRRWRGGEEEEEEDEASLSGGDSDSDRDSEEGDAPIRGGGQPPGGARASSCGEAAKWTSAMSAASNNASQAMDDGRFKPKSRKGLTLRDKSTNCGKALANIGDDGRGMINPRYVWCGGCGKPFYLNQLAKLGQWRDRHLITHHPLLGKVLDGKLALADMEDPPDYEAESNPGRVRAAEWHAKYTNRPSDSELVREFGELFPCVEAVVPTHGADAAAPSRDDDEGGGVSLGGDGVAERERGADREHTDRERGADRERADFDRGADRDRADGADSAADDDDAAVPSRRDDDEGDGASLDGDGVADDHDRNADDHDRADRGRSPDHDDDCDDRDDRAGHGSPEQAGDGGISSPDGNEDGSSERKRKRRAERKEKKKGKKGKKEKKREKKERERKRQKD